MTKDESIRLASDIAQIKKREKWYKRWRLLAILLLVVTIFSMMPSSKKDASHIALVNIDSAIMKDSYFWDDLDRINADTRAVIFLMNSPGGTVGDSERLYNQIQAIKSKVPVVVLVENQATSGAYLASLASDKIYAYNGALIGSVGVIFSSYLIKDLLNNYGIKKEEIKTGRFKGYPNGYDEMPPEVRTNMQDLLNATNDWFLSLVKDRRQLSSTDVIEQAQVYIAKDALKNGLIDGIATRDQLIKVLRDKVGYLPVKDLSIDEEDSFGLSKIFPRGRHAFWKGIFGAVDQSGLMAIDQ